MRFKVATVAAAVLATVLVINHLIAPTLHGLYLSPTGRPTPTGPLPGHLQFILKLDDFAVDYGYLLVAFAWVVSFLVSTIWANLRNFFPRKKAACTPEDWPGEP